MNEDDIKRIIVESLLTMGFEVTEDQLMSLKDTCVSQTSINEIVDRRKFDLTVLAQI